MSRFTVIAALVELAHLGLVYYSCKYISSLVRLIFFAVIGSPHLVLMADSDVGASLVSNGTTGGPILLGTIINTTLFGMFSVQLHSYLRKFDEFVVTHCVSTSIASTIDSQSVSVLATIL